MYIVFAFNSSLQCVKYWDQLLGKPFVTQETSLLRRHLYFPVLLRNKLCSLFPRTNMDSQGESKHIFVPLRGPM